MPIIQRPAPTILLYRRRLSLTSGVGQLLAMQANGLERAGHDVRIAGRKGCLKYFVRTRWWPRRMSIARVCRAAAELDTFVVDHETRVPEAGVVFVHNLMTEANRHLERADLEERVAEERDFFRRVRGDSLIVVNSTLVRRSLGAHFDLDPERIVVAHPGFQSSRFNRETQAALRGPARRLLGIPDGRLLIGFITSGDLHKRGLDLFLEAARGILSRESDARFLVVGSKRLPDWAARHPLIVDGRVMYRPKGARPEQWLSALDIFLYAARFEEFGMVVAEAQAVGLPVVTSRLVGAAECLPEAYAGRLLDRPEAEGFAEKTLELIADPAARRVLAAAGIENAAAYDDRAYAARTVPLIVDRIVDRIVDQKRRLR